MDEDVLVADAQGRDGGRSRLNPSEAFLEVGEVGAYKNCREGWKDPRRVVVASMWYPGVVGARGRGFSLCVCPFALDAA